MGLLMMVIDGSGGCAAAVACTEEARDESSIEDVNVGLRIDGGVMVVTSSWAEEGRGRPARVCRQRQSEARRCGGVELLGDARSCYLICGACSTSTMMVVMG
ncbi:hypothetical protein M0R45_016430 [Rubus argutus]|uniref:Secreted protein n=1 Tax=Rubus argutus TaxID=59490 RepID=A0AAW1XTJ6_RUBAR